MKNITLAIDEEVLDEARRVAANRKTTVNGLVREFLQRIVEQENRAERAMRELARMSERTTGELGPRTWTRDELYDR